MMAASKLDTDKFRKVRELMERGSTEGERQAARSRASAIAAKAGMTLDAAMKQDDKQKAERARSTHYSWNAEDLHRAAAERAKHEQAERERREKEQWAAYREKRNREQKARFDEAVRKHGPAEPGFAETPEELRLKAFFEPYQIYKEASGDGERYMDGLTGCGHKYPKETQAQFMKLMNEAIPLPADLPGLIAEWEAWENLRKRRYVYEPEYEDYHAVQARIEILEELIREVPVRNWHEMDVRMQWMRDEFDRDRWRDHERDVADLERLKADLAFLRGASDANHVQSGRMTNAEKAEAVKSRLMSNPAFSDRENARQAGVSPQTVNNWRARLGLQKEAA
jgi:hypothetical protein